MFVVLTDQNKWFKRYQTKRGKGFVMSGIALLFPGQGSQYKGMGVNTYKYESHTKRLMEEASDILGYDMYALCNTGEIEQLSRTSYTQPVLLTMSMIAFHAYMHQIGIEPTFTAGHSLGEYSALVASEALSFQDGLRIVQQRGQFMENASQDHIGSMIAVRGIAVDELELLCMQHRTSEQPVVIACYNSPLQHVVAGHSQALERLTRSLEQQKVQMNRLSVSGPFHTILMQHAADRLATALHTQSFQQTRWPVISNVTAEPYASDIHIVQGLIDQMTCAVKWQQSLLYMVANGIHTTVEIGPRNILTRLSEDIAPDLSGYAFDKEQDRHRLIQDYPVDVWIKECLAQSISLPNHNWNENEYAQGVIEPVQQLKQMLGYLTTSSSKDLNAADLRQQATAYLTQVIDTKQCKKINQKDVLTHQLVGGLA